MDRRELIIARLFAVAASVEGIETAVRNRTEFDDTRLPAVSVLEGDEEVDDRDIPLTRPSDRPYRVIATPQVFIRVATDVDNAGTNLNTIRQRIIKAVLQDAELNALSLNGRGVRPAGQVSQLHAARSMIGASALMFSIEYIFSTAEL